MLGIRLSDDEEQRLTRHAQERGRAKSAIVREWIREQLDRDDVDEQIRRAAALHARHVTSEQRRAAGEASDAFIRWLDSDDGGYDWGSEGPPPVK